ncbi:MAG: S8 family serine peptidase [Clostridia bacterium]|nr:S8 family serine peptidase [Clostridia bacterium]
MKNIRTFVCFVIAFCLILGSVPMAFAETVAEDAALVSGSAELRDYSIPTDSKHAYDPFAELESEEATQAYRESVQYESDTIIYKVEETKTLFADFKDRADAADLQAAGIDPASATELSRKKVENGLFTDTYEVIYQADLNGEVWEAVDALAETAGVVDAQPNYLYEDTAIDLPTIEKNPDQDKQWHHGPDHLECDKHWQHMYEEGITPGEGAIVAVIDTGVDYTHPDLEANMWINVAEKNGTAGVDDDGNGYVDDIYGVSTVGATRYHSGDPMDDHGHGTHVAGIIAMTANNDEGAVGIAYGTKIMAIKAGQASGVFSDTDIAEAIKYAVANGADVINMSFGGTGKSFLVEEALSDAFSTCVLVAAAGNDGIPTADAPGDFMKKADFYPAGHSFVLGVMASDENGNLAGFSNWDYYGNGGSAEYELTAPGTNIYSTLPGGQYASWDGTSMASPVVAATAALVRSKYPDKSLYSSRFIMGQLASATEDTLTYVDKIGKGHVYGALNIEDSLNKLPKPNLIVKNSYLFDDPAIDPANDGDGIIDAGETIDLGLVLRNQWGMAGNVTVTADAVSVGGVANPSIEFLTDTVSFDNIGTFNEQTNGFVYENDALVGAEKPIRFKVKENTVNDSLIVLNLTVTAANALDPEDTAVYIIDPKPTVSFIVQRGKAISGTIKEDLTLTAEDYWIVENTVYIPEGVTVTVEPGTQIQFWSSDPNDPYAANYMAYIEVDGEFLVNGTAENPVEMFPSALYQDYGVDIRDGIEPEYAAHLKSTCLGTTRMKYANIINPRLNINQGEHLNIVQNTGTISYRVLKSGTVSRYYGYSLLQVFSFKNSCLKNLRVSDYSDVCGRYENVIFDGCSLGVSGENEFSRSELYVAFERCVFLGKNSFSGTGSTVTNPGESITNRFTRSPVYAFGGKKYLALAPTDGVLGANSYQSGDGYKKDSQSEAMIYIYNGLAALKGGTMACINSPEESAFLCELGDAVENSFSSNLLLGGWTQGGKLLWLDGTVEETSSKDGLLRCISGNGSGKAYVGGVWMYNSVGDNSFIMEFPASVSDEEILRPFTDAELLSVAKEYEEYLGTGALSLFEGNAVLNEFISGNTAAWTTVGTTRNHSYFFLAENNYWGTDNEKLIQAQITDADTYASLADIVTDPYLTLDSPALEDIYPFVTEAYITDTEGNRIDSCGYQEIQVHVTFNRDMDPEILPMVSFGPAEPYTDYVVEGDFVDARHWVGTTKVSTVIDSGLEYLRIKDAAAADDTWLTTGTDAARFAFTVSSTGAEALNLQAEGGEDQVNLSWTQDDYDTLAGFNIYRSDKEDGTFTKINSRLIPGTIREYTDTNVEPGKEYFYYFTVMGTDLRESVPSNVTSATPLDNIKPTMTHTRVTEANYGEAISFTATVTDNIGVEYVNIYYRAKGESDWKTLKLSKTEGNNYYGVIAANDVSADGMEYYIEASDGTTTVRDGSDVWPLQIAVDDSMVIYSVSPSKLDTAKVTEGVTVQVHGVNFTEGMTLTVGGKQVEYTFTDSKQISFVAPAGNIGRVDVTLTDGERSAMLSNALTYTDASAEVQIIAPDEVKAKETVKLPIIAKANGEISGLDLQLKIDRSLYSTVTFELSAKNAGAYQSCTANSSGVVKIAVATANTLDISEPVGYLVLTPKVATDAIPTTVEITAAKMNAVVISKTVDCNLVIKPNFTVSGTVTYYNGNASLEGVKVKLSNGMVTYTDAEGNYTFTGVTTNRVTVIPTHSGNVNNAISAQDAAELLIAITDETHSLTDRQFTAADVDGDGELTSLDAVYILRKAVGMIEGPYNGTGAEWAFDAPARVLNLTDNVSDVNFSGILLGDVTGNWTAEAEGGLS